jgi:membrane carboxypeptidase/penicillin-binding protein
VDSRLQRAADVALRSAVLEYDRRHGWRGAMSLPHETTKSPPLVKTDGGKTNIAVV